MDTMRALAWVIAVGLVGASAARAQEPLPAPGLAAPRFRLPVYNPEPVGASSLGLERYVGAQPEEPGVKVVLLSFMASFCKPCKKEMPYLESLHRRYRALGLRVVLVSIDSEPEGQQQMAALIREHAISYPVLKDRFNLVARRWLGEQSPLPSLFFVQPDGTVSRVHRGYDEQASLALEGEVQQLLGVEQRGTKAVAADAVP
jgi:thiol-disulfide isomerase/thioredoxin